VGGGCLTGKQPHHRRVVRICVKTILRAERRTPAYGCFGARGFHRDVRRLTVTATKETGRRYTGAAIIIIETRATNWTASGIIIRYGETDA